MRKQLIVLLMMMLSGLSVIFSQNVENYTVKKISSRLTIDGHLNESVWTLAKSTTDFVVLGKNQTAETQAYAKMLWDETYLYVAFYCQDSKVWATYTDRDDPLYKEDVVEVYIDPDGDGENYLEIEVNPLNTIFDLWLTKPWADGGQGHTDWTMAGLLTAISVDGTVANNSDDDAAWICEMALPFSEMQFAAPSRHYPPEEYDKWRYNMYRFDRSSTSNSVGEATGWSQTDGGQHEPDKFGVITFGSLMSDIAQSEHSIHDFVLSQNYPNPFNPTTTIHYQLPSDGFVNLVVTDALGRTVATIVDEYKHAGHYYVEFDGSNLSSGLYFYRIQMDHFTDTRTLILQK